MSSSPHLCSNSSPPIAYSITVMICIGVQNNPKKLSDVWLLVNNFFPRFQMWLLVNRWFLHCLPLLSWSSWPEKWMTHVYSASSIEKGNAETTLLNYKIVTLKSNDRPIINDTLWRWIQS